MIKKITESQLKEIQARGGRVVREPKKEKVSQVSQVSQPVPQVRSDRDNLMREVADSTRQAAQAAAEAAGIMAMRNSALETMLRTIAEQKPDNRKPRELKVDVNRNELGYTESFKIKVIY